MVDILRSLVGTEECMYKYFGETAPNLCWRPWIRENQHIIYNNFGYLISKPHKEACLYLI